jgi:predicted histone-like DNA-binding protein
MALKIKAKEKKLKFSKDGPEVYRYVMVPDLYSTLDSEKVIKEAAIRSGVSEGVMQACWKGAGEVIKAWATEGHSVALPGLGNMRFGLSAKAVADVNDVKTSLIRTRRIIFTPTVALKDELANTAIQITCYDRNGEVVKRVTSADPGTVEEPQGDDNGQNTENSENNEQNGNSGSENGSQSGQQGEQNQPQGYALQIVTSGSGSATVTHDGNTITSGTSLNEDDEVKISITPAEGKVPTASINSSPLELTEDNGVYTGSFAMPGQASALVISTGVSGDGGDGGDGLDQD